MRWFIENQDQYHEKQEQLFNGLFNRRFHLQLSFHYVLQCNYFHYCLPFACVSRGFLCFGGQKASFQCDMEGGD